ncbi:Ribonuclease H-like superfamily [Sesbania bispinosa]|nr:Ribonuclease H-like superfamily [Sesbania bispinosa]
MENEGNSQPSIPTQSSIQASPAQSSFKPSHTPTTEVPTTNVETQTADNADIIEGAGGKRLKSVLLGGSSKNGTKHLHQHMDICVQKKIAMRGQNKGQPVLLTKMTQGRQELVAASYDPDNARKKLGCAIIMHDYPLSIVEHIGFRRYSTALQPMFQVPCRNTIKKEIIKIYEFEKSVVSKMLDTNDGRVAITSDMWTASNQKKGYMAATAHYIDGSWTLQSFVLRFIYVPAPHTSDRLSNLLVDCLLDRNIDTKLSTITLDNCSTNDSMINKIRDKLRERFIGRGTTSSTRRRYNKSVMQITVISEGEAEHPHYLPLTFSDEDFKGIMPHEHDPKVIEVTMAAFNVQRVLVDQGSSTNVMY